MPTELFAFEIWNGKFDTYHLLSSRRLECFVEAEKLGRPKWKDPTESSLLNKECLRYFAQRFEESPIGLIIDHGDKRLNVHSLRGHAKKEHSICRFQSLQIKVVTMSHRYKSLTAVEKSEQLRFKKGTLAYLLDN